MIKYLLLFIVSFPLIIQAQNKGNVKENPGCDCFKINFVRALADEIPFYYEYNAGSGKVRELKGGVIYPNPVLSSWAEISSASPRFMYWGAFAGSGFKWFSKKDDENYLAFNYTYKYKFFNEKKLWLGGLSGSDFANELHLSQRLHVLNLQLVFGNQVNDSKGLKEFYGGFGVNFTYAKTLLHGCTFCEPDFETKENHYSNPYYNNGIYFAPTIHIGYKVGLGKVENAPQQPVKKKKKVKKEPDPYVR